MLSASVVNERYSIDNEMVVNNTIYTQKSVSLVVSVY